MPAATGNTAPALSSVTIFFFCWAVLTYVLRLWVKLPKRNFWGADDTLISLALAAAFANLIATCYAVSHGFGNAWSSLSDVASVETALYAGQLLYVISLGGQYVPHCSHQNAHWQCLRRLTHGQLTRLSNSLFTARFVARAQEHLRMANIIAVLFGVWTITSLFVIALRQPLKSPWQNRDGSRSLFLRWTVVESIGCVLDLGAVAFSAHLVWTLQMPLARRLAVISIFATRLLIVPIIAVRLWKLSPSQNANPSIPSTAAEVLTEVVMATALNLASVTCLKPFLRPFEEAGFIPGSSQNVPSKYGITGASRLRSETYLMLGTAGSTTRNKDGSIVHAPTEKELDDVTRRQNMPRMKLRADPAHNEAACEHDGTRGHNINAPKDIRVSRTVDVQRHRDL